MSSPSTPKAPRRVATADVIGGVLLTAIAVGAYLLTGEWSDNAALFPRSVSLGAAALGVLLVIVSLIGRREAAEHLTEDEHDDQLEYIFHSAGLRQWLTAAGWFASFFVSLYVLGMYATAIVFTVAYLRSQDNRSWAFTGVYSVIMTGALYLLFSVVLRQPVPPGFFGLA